VSTKEIIDTSLGVRRRPGSWPEALKREIVEADRNLLHRIAIGVAEQWLLHRCILAILLSQRRLLVSAPIKTLKNCHSATNARDSRKYTGYSELIHLGVNAGARILRD
jgi:hypothetical protein